MPFRISRCCPAAVLFELGEETSNKEHQDHPLQCRKGDGRRRKTDGDVKAQEKEITQRVSEKYEVRRGKVVQILIYDKQTIGNWSSVIEQMETLSTYPKRQIGRTATMETIREKIVLNIK